MYCIYNKVGNKKVNIAVNNTITYEGRSCLSHFYYKIPEKLREYSIATKSGMMDVETAESVAKELDIELIAVTGEQGKVGALAALGLYDDVEEAVKEYDK